MRGRRGRWSVLGASGLRQGERSRARDFIRYGGGGGRDERAGVNACKSRGWWDAEMIISLPSVRHLYSFMSFSSEIFFNIYF